MRLALPLGAGIPSVPVDWGCPDRSSTGFFPTRTSFYYPHAWARNGLISPAVPMVKTRCVRMYLNKLLGLSGTLRPFKRSLAGKMALRRSSRGRHHGWKKPESQTKKGAGIAPAPSGQPLYVARFSSLRGAYLGNFVVHHLHQVAIQGLGEFIDHRLHSLAEAIFLGRGDQIGRAHV